MSDKMRWRYGDTDPVVAAVDSATVIEIGDLVLQDTNNAKPFSSADLTTFVPRFLGVAMQRSHVGDIQPIRVATTGVFEFDCPSETFELGDLIGPTSNQSVKKVHDKENAIGRVAKRVSTAGTSVLVDIRSTVMTGGV
jgi:fructose 1,6-bisphosphatase